MAFPELSDVKLKILQLLVDRQPCKRKYLSDALAALYQLSDEERQQPHDSGNGNVWNDTVTNAVEWLCNRKQMIRRTNHATYEITLIGISVIQLLPLIMPQGTSAKDAFLNFEQAE